MSIPISGDQKFVFIHIGKTAGTSLRVTISRALGPQSCSEPFIQNYMTAGEAAHYDNFQVICGHISRADQIKWFPDRRVITVLREPLDRCLSFIHYVRSLPPEIAPDPHRLSVLDFIEDERAQHNLHNTMVRQLGGHMLDDPDDFPGLLERAKRTLEEAFWVGRRDTIDADLARLGRLLGNRFQMVRENVTPARPPIACEDPKIVDRLRELNRYDDALWQWAAARHLPGFAAT